MIIKETERLVEIKAEIEKRLERNIKNLMDIIRHEFAKLKENERTVQDLDFDLYDELMFNLKIDSILEKYRLTKKSDKRLVFQRIKFLLENSIFSGRYNDLKNKGKLSDEERKEMEKIAKYMKDAYALLRFML